MKTKPALRALSAVFILSLTQAGVAAGGLPAALAPVALTCEHRVNPLGIGELTPRLGWKLEATDPAARGLRQSAFRVLVASSPAQLAGDRGDLWDSGKFDSDQTCNLAYGGRTLEPRQQAWWKVQVWDQQGRLSGWSEPALWSRGLGGEGDWQGQWIGLDSSLPEDGSTLTAAQRERVPSLHWMAAAIEPRPNQPSTIHARRAFVLPEERRVTSAAFWVVPDQVAAITVNGRPAGAAARWDRARPFDVTALLVAGENVLALEITQQDGYGPAALGELEIHFAEGEPLRVPTDDIWKFSVEFTPGWGRTGFATESWKPMKILPDSPWGTPQNATLFLPPAPYLRKEFAVTKAVRRATVYATALGVYELQLNGRPVSSDRLAPGWTDYNRRTPYQTYDVTTQVQAGTNVLGAILGDGWFGSTLGFLGRRCCYGAYPRFRAQLEIEYGDGAKEIVPTDVSWRAAFGAVRYADLLQGCAYDARLEWPGWSEPGFDDSKWSAARGGIRPVDSDQAPVLTQFVVEAATLDSVRVMEELPAKGVTEPRPGAYVVDFGQNLVGWVRFTARGQRGQKVVLRHAEMLNPNGTVYTSNLRGATATDVFWLRGGEETLEPRFTFHGFRYVEVTGLDAPPRPGDFTGIVAHSPLARTGDFTCSNPFVNQLFHNIIWGQKGNYFEAPTDCPQRDERLGWTGDTQFFARTGAFNYDIAAFMERWLVTLIEDTQAADGTFGDVAPAIPRRARVSTGWGDAAIVCTHVLWQVYGDTRPIRRHYDALARYLGFLDSRAKDGVASVGGYGDWLDQGGAAAAPVIDTAYYAYLCRLMAEMGAAIGRPDAAENFAAKSRAVTRTFQRQFLLPDGGIKDGGQTGYALAFTMDLLPDALKEAAAARFVESMKAHDWHPATGFIGTPRLLPALHLAGHDDVAYRVLLQDSYPSWLFQVKLGATTMWERWDGWTPEKGFQAIGMNSFNHYAFGAVGEYLYRHVAGIDTDGPGFRRILIQPRPGGGLTFVRASYDAITGQIASAWKIADGELQLDVTVPPNTTATIRVPAKKPALVREGRRMAARAPGVLFLGAVNGEAVYRVGSGTYRFSTPE